MQRWMIRVHLYTGLFNFTALVLFGVVGVVASFLPRHAERWQPAPVVEELDFEVPGDMDDRQLADHIQASLALPHTGPAPDWSLRRDDAGRLRFRLHTPARRYDVLVLEEADRLRLETRRYGASQYLIHLHEMVPSRAAPDFRVQVWAWYVEASIWSLMLMAVSGVYLWASSRPGHRWAQVCLGAGTLVVAGFYWFLR